MTQYQYDVLLCLSAFALLVGVAFFIRSVEAREFFSDVRKLWREVWKG